MRRGCPSGAGEGWPHPLGGMFHHSRLEVSGFGISLFPLRALHE